MAIIYGPVASWRLGRSLGIDLLNTKRKVCTFNCIYCQLGETSQFFVEPEEFIILKQLRSELESLSPIEADYVTFSGMGEPTLASNLGQAIELARSILDLPVAVLTNCSLMCREDVRQQLTHADVVVAKLDVPNEELFSMVNRPDSSLRFDAIVDGMRRFRSTYLGKLALQAMFVRANEGYAEEIANLAQSILPDEVQINTPLRPSKVKPLPPENIANIQANFSNLRNVVTVYEAPRREARPINPAETLRRRPDLNDSVGSFRLHGG
ncbi:MAG: radical SAM protein [Dehalococcoidia bacterium]|jgi:wyosine [tRNA(Phe)-imidazoG37] synthetase (radical SAM superfamily)